MGSRYQQATGKNGMVASAHYLASQAGLWMLRQGGNAVDAAVCAASTIAVVCPNLNGVGGDVFAQVWTPDAGLPAGLNASGRSGSLATIDRVRALGHVTMPNRGPISIVVPGAVSGWQALLDRFGTRRLFDVLEPAIEYAEHGAPVTPGIAAALTASQDFLKDDPGFRSVFWFHDKPRGEGASFANPNLAASLRELGRTDGEAIYRGELAGRLAKGLSDAGSLIERQDLERHRADWVNPIRTTFRGVDVFELPPNSQGIAALEMLNMAEAAKIDSVEHNSAAYVAGLCHIIELAIADRDQFITDPNFSEAPIDRLVSKDYATQRLRDAAGCPADAGDADTIYLCVADASGMAVSLIQSQYRGFGSGFMAPGTGIHLNNRGSYFSLDPLDVNRLEPLKRTMHTLMPAMAGDGPDRLVFGTMGGDAQPQIHLQFLLNHLASGMNLQEAIEAPRFVWSPEGGSGRRVSLEGRFPSATVAGLREMGFEVEILEDWSSQMGHAQAIRVDRQKGSLTGAADPRGDGAALGF